MIDLRAKPAQGLEKLSEKIVLLEEVVRKASVGIKVDDVRAYAKNICSRKFKGALSFDIYLQDGAEEEHLLCMAVFPGRKPHYKPWIELFCIQGSLRSGRDYYGSAVEDSLLKFFSESVGPGGRIFIEYYNDLETSCGLAMGFPPEVTRQGYKLFTLGFTWFKDWYFSEGGHEGGQKLQGERPLDEAARRKHMHKIRREAEAFLELSADWKADGEAQEYLLYLHRAKKRGRVLLDGINSYYPSP